MKPRTPIIFLTASLLLLAALAACATGPGRPPTALEQKLFTIQTNFVPQVEVHVVVQTNFVTVPLVTATTNIVYETNVLDQVVTHTNVLEVTREIHREVLSTNNVTVTNQVPAYTLTPNATANAITAGAETAGNMAGPYGGLAAGLVGGIFGLWGHLRSSKSNAATATLAQVIETGSELMKSTPQGQVLADKWKTWMISHQAAEGVIEQVTKVVANEVDNQDARAAADKLLAVAQTVKAS